MEWTPLENIRKAYFAFTAPKILALSMDGSSVVEFSPEALTVSSSSVVPPPADTDFMGAK